MPPKRKIYIKNCTGQDCDAEKSNNHKIYLRVSFYLLLFVFCCLVLYMLFFSSEMQINNVKVEGTKDLDAQEIAQLSEENLQGKYVGIFPKNNYLLTSGNSMSGILKEKYKKIRTIEIKKKFPNTLEIKIDEHDSLLIWCQNESQCYLLDEDGVAYNKADFNSPELTQNKLLTVIDSSGAAVNIGNVIMQQNYEKYLLNIKNELAKLGIATEDNFRTPSGMAEEIEIKTTDGYSIFLSTQFTLDSAMKTLTTVFKKEIPKEKLAELEYIDLRSEYKAFYKYKSSVQQNDAQENTKEDVESKK